MLNVSVITICTISNELNVEGLTFPIEIGQIPIFETNNPDFSVNVICTNSDEDQTFIPLYASQHRDRKHTVNLLLLSEGERRHYILIRNLSRLLSVEILIDIKPFHVHSASTVSQPKQVCRIIEANAAPMAFNASHIPPPTLTLVFFKYPTPNAYPIHHLRRLRVLPGKIRYRRRQFH